MSDTDRRPQTDYCAILRDEIEGRVEATAAQSGNDGTTEAAYTESIFTDWCAELLEGGGYIAGFEPASWEFSPPTRGTVYKINGYHLNLENASASLFLTSWDPAGWPAISTAKRVEQLVAPGTAFLGAALIINPPLHTKLEPADPHTTFARLLWEHRDDLRKVTLHFFTNSLVSAASFDAQMLGDIPMAIEVWDARRLMRIQEGTSDEIDEISVEFEDGLPCLHSPTTDERCDGYLAVISGNKLAQIYDVYGPRLLQENVRAFLQLTASTNQGMRRTLMGEPEAFFAYNNGLSATARLVETSGEGDALRIRRILGLQIVNGAQTTGSIHRVWRASAEALDGVQVPFKLTRVDGDTRQDMVSRISRYANSQTAVKLDDFSSNQPFHVELENRSRRIWAPPNERHRWFYERTRGQYNDELGQQATAGAVKKFRQENPTRQRFTKTDVGRYVHAWDCKPELVALGAQKNYIRFNADIQKTSFLPDDDWYRDLIAKAIIFDAVLGIVRRAKISAYGANVVAYMVALISHRYDQKFDLRTVWDAQALSPGAISCLESWPRPVYDCLVASAGEKNVTEWCKKPGCWEAVREISLQSMPDETPEIAVAVGRPQTSGEADAREVQAPVEIDFSSDREKLLRLAQQIVAGRSMRRADAIKELQERLGIKRLSTEKRAELESVFEDSTHLAFVDDDATMKTNKGLALMRKLLRTGTQDHAVLLSELARDWLEKQRIGSRVRQDLDELTKIAISRSILLVDDDHVSCPTPQFDFYTDDMLGRAVMSTVQRRGRLYPRRTVTEATLSSLGFTHLRSEMLGRIDQCVETLVTSKFLECPSPGWLRRARTGGE
ncbi:MAG: AIPR family protein [Byssovorax sp.]